MADNTAITPGSGETIRDKDRTGVKTQILGIDVAVGTATEVLMDATAAAALPTREIGAANAPATQVTVSSTSVAILAARTSAPARRYALIINQQTVPIWIDPNGGTAVANSGIRIDPGAAITLPSTAAVNGIAAAAYTATADAKVQIIEFY